MQQPVIISQINLDFAFLQVANFSQVQQNNAHLYTVPDGALVGRIDSVWDSIRAAIQEAFIYGKEKVKDATQAIIDQVNEWMEKAGSKAAEIHNQLIQRLRIFIKSLIDSALTLVPTTTIIGDVPFMVSKVSFNQKLVLGGSLKTNILEAVALTSSGELALSVEYSKVGTV